MHFRKAVFAAAAGLVVGLVAAPASASNVSFFDLTDGPPTFSVSSDIDVTLVRSTAESLHLEGTLHIPFGNGRIQNAGGANDQSFILLEGNGSISDFVHFVSGGSGPGAVDFLEDFVIDFFSDPAIPAGVGGLSIFENGTLQALPFNSSGLQGGSFFGISVHSDPEPSALALLGLALAGLSLMRRKSAR